MKRRELFGTLLAGIALAAFPSAQCQPRVRHHHRGLDGQWTMYWQKACKYEIEAEKVRGLPWHNFIVETEPRDYHYFDLTDDPYSTQKTIEKWISRTTT